VKRAAVVTLGCARNETDSDELAGRLIEGGWEVSGPEDSGRPDVIVVNTCGFVAQAKKDSIDAILGLSGDVPVVAVGCLAERYGHELATELPEAAAVLGFDAYPDIAAMLDRVAAGEVVASHTPADRRLLLPISPVGRPGAAVVVPGHGDHSVPQAGRLRPVRHRLTGGVVAPLKLASGCDRRCAFCAIPSFRGSFVSRPPAEVLQEAHALAEQGVKELLLVSENSTSYGKDLGDLQSLEKLLPALAAVPGIVRVRPVYLQPAEVRPSLVEVITGTRGVAAYADLSFQHASEPVLRRMRRFGSSERFLALLEDFRAKAPQLGARSNVIVGFPGESAADVRVLSDFLERAGLDAVGVFAYSDEDGTEAQRLPGKVSPRTVRERQRRVADLVEQLVTQRAEDRLGETVEVLVETVEDGVAEGRGEHQQPEVDGTCTLLGEHRVGDLVTGTVVDTHGVDLVVQPS
jgi:ribosomal protein S12 methylthiotransferase